MSFLNHGAGMDKAELRRILNEKVEEKVAEGYTITTYAMDVASTDRVKRELSPHGHAIPHEDESPEWESYLKQVEAGTYVPEQVTAQPVAQPEKPMTQPGHEGVSGSVGLWKARRH